jgi:hypothetical protein
MIHQRLKTAYDELDNYCRDHGLAYDLLVDEDDLQGYMIMRGQPADGVIDHMRGVAVENDLYMRSHKTRSGTVLTLSLLAISEGTVLAMVPPEDGLRFVRRLDLVMDNWGPIDEAHGLEGIAADYQPRDVLAQFKRALNDLGLIDSLRQSGIINRLSDDKQIIHFFIQDADRRPREVCSFELLKLAESSVMEKAIKDLADLARRRAPGTSDLEAQRIRERDQYVKKVAQRRAPAEVQKAMADDSVPPSMESLIYRLRALCN